MCACRSQRCLAPGYLAAPFGSAAICFTHVVGLASLKEWDAQVLDEVRGPRATRLSPPPNGLRRGRTEGRGPASRTVAPPAAQSLALYRSIAGELLMALGGYLMEAVDGLVLVAFPRPAQAMRWALALVDACLNADWPSELLEHELGEEVAIQRVRQQGLGSGVLGGATGPLAQLQDGSITNPSAMAAVMHHAHQVEGSRLARTLLFRGLRLK